MKQPLSDPIRLFNLEEDLAEEHDLASKHPEKVTQMKAMMEDAYTPSSDWKFPKPRRKKSAK